MILFFLSRDRELPEFSKILLVAMSSLLTELNSMLDLQRRCINPTFLMLNTAKSPFLWIKLSTSEAQILLEEASSLYFQGLVSRSVEAVPYVCLWAGG